MTLHGCNDDCVLYCTVLLAVSLHVTASNIPLESSQNSLDFF